MENLLTLFQLYVHPARAMSRILDYGNWVFGVIAAVVLSLLLSFAQPVFIVREQIPQPSAAGPAGQELDEIVRHAPAPPSAVERFGRQTRSTSTVLILFCIFVPLCIVAITGLERLGSITTVLFRDYAALLACCSFGWIAARIPIAALDGFFPENSAFTGALGLAYFLFLMVVAVQVLTGSGFGGAVAAVLLSAGATGGLIATNILGFVIPYIASPFFLFFFYRYFSGDLQSLGQGLRSRQHFRQQLEAATLNPHDADAQVQLGLIYQARRQYDQAADRFRKALEIDPDEPEANLQLGRIVRDQGRFDEALPHFQAVARTHPKFSSYEVWRDAASVYLARKRYTDARPVLEHYVAQRPFDAEGLYYWGQTLEGLSETAAAREAYQRCIEAVRTAPGHRKRFVNPWGRLAQRRLRDLRSK